MCAPGVCVCCLKDTFSLATKEFVEQRNMSVRGTGSINLDPKTLNQDAHMCVITSRLTIQIN